MSCTNDVQFYSLNLHYCGSPLSEKENKQWTIQSQDVCPLDSRDAKKILKLPVHTESSQTDINGKAKTFVQKRKKYTKVQYTTQIHESYNGTINPRLTFSELQ